MANNQNNPQPSTSGQHNGLHRADTSISEPLTAEEMAELKKQLNYEGGARNFETRELEPLDVPVPKRDKESPQAPWPKQLPPVKWVDENCFIARGISMQEVCLVSENVLNSHPSREGQVWGSLIDPLERADTLERNPICVDPNQVQAQIVKSEHYQVVQTQSQQMQWEDPTSTITFGPEDLLLLQQNGTPTVNNYGPTSANPCIDDFKGDCSFGIAFEAMTASNKSKHWDYSDSLKKLFVDMNKYILGTFNIGSNPPEGLIIRALPIYAVAGFFTSPVRRCPNHAHQDDPSNRDEMWKDKRDHLIRVDNDFAIYEEDSESKRLSVIIPVQRPQTGSTSFAVPLKFMCLGSDVGGINRKPLKVIFTLEHGTANVIARHTIDVRICSCPKRDRQQEEKRKQDGLRAAENLARANSSLVVSQPPEKKKRLESVEEMILVPVAKRDYDAVNKHAEALLISRHIDKIDDIKNARRKLLLKHNPGGTFSSSMMNKPKHSDEKQ